MDSGDTHFKPLNTYVLVLSLICIAAYALLYFIWGETLPVNDGLGWDGVTYAAYATNFIHEITTTSDVYHVTRIVPSLIIFTIKTIFKIDLATPYAICTMFYLLNTVMFLGAAYFWYKICRLKSFNTYIYLVGFISLFINYACLKLALYAPISVDPSVLFFGVCVLYLYLKKNYISICIVSFFIFFTWPVAIVLVMPLIIYTFSDKKLLDYSPSRKINAALITCIFIGVVSLLIYVLLYRSYLVSNWSSLLYCWSQAWWPATKRVTSWIYFILPVSIVIASFYVYYVAFYSNFYNVIKNINRIYFPNLVLYLTTITICMAMSFWLSHLSLNYTGKTVFSGSEFLAITLLGAIAKPALNLIMHAIFLGPCTLLWLLYMRSIIKEANKESFGLLLFVIITYFMALNSHSRQLTFNVPFMIYLLCSVLNNLITIKNRIRFLAAYAMAAIISSKIYILINAVPFEGDILSNSFQRFFMNFGLWTRWPGYFFNMGVTLLMCLFLYIGFYRNKKHIISTSRILEENA